MSIISIPFTFSAGAVIIAAQHNSNFSTIYSDYNGFIDNTNISSSASISYTKLNLSNSIVNADINSSAAIVDSKLATISTPSKVNISALTVASQAQGDIIYASGTTTWARLGAGTSGQVLQTQGTNFNPIWGNGTHGIQIFNSSGTFTAPSGITKIFVSMVGGGGGGGASDTVGSGGGGGGGASLLNYPYTVIVGNNYTVTVGAKGLGIIGSTGGNGGQSIFDTVLIVNGGNGGVRNGGSGGTGGASISANSLTGIASGSGGAGGGIIPAIATVAGGTGGAGASGNVAGGGGGGSIWGAGGAGGNVGVGSSPLPNTGAGGGGHGGNTLSDAGADGAVGCVLITY